MLLIGHEHIMKIPEEAISWSLVFVGIALIYIGIFCSKEFKGHILAYTCFP